MSYRTGYLRSDHWQDKRKQVWSQNHPRCSVCRKEGPLDVHHLTYRHKGDEPLEDLTLLCRSCHDAVHELARQKKNPNWTSRWLREVTNYYRSQVYGATR